MTAAQATASIGDEGVLNRQVSQPLADAWIDRDLSWLDFNDRVLAEALDECTPECVKLLRQIRDRQVGVPRRALRGEASAIADIDGSPE